MNYQALENAIEAMEQARQEIISIEADSTNRATLDAAYNGLKMAIDNLSKLVKKHRLHV